MRTQWRKVFRDVSSRKTRTAMVSISIFIGVLGVVTMITAGDLIMDSVNASFDEEKLAMLYAFVELDEGVDGTTIDQHDVLDTLRAYPEVTVAEGQSSEILFWKTPDDTNFIEGIVRTNTEDWGTEQIEPMVLIEGDYPAVAENEILIERQMANRYDLSVGDTLTLRLMGQLQVDLAEATEIPEEDWTIAGIIYHPYVGNNSMYVNFDDFTYLTGVSHVERFLVRFTDYETLQANVDHFGRVLNRDTPYKHELLRMDDPANHPAIEESEQWSMALIALSLIAMLVSSFLVVTVINTIVVEQKQQIGVMKSLGATRLKTFGIYAGIALFYGLIGMVPGVLLGIPAGYFLADAVALLANTLVEDFYVSPTGVGAGILLGLLVPLLSAIVPVFLGTRVRILDAITDVGISSQYGKSFINRLIGRLPLPISMRQALANIYQKKGRLAMTGLTLTLAIGAFMGVSAVFVSLDDDVQSFFDTYNFELVVVPVKPETYDYDEVGKLLQQNVDDVQTIYPGFNQWVEIIDERQSENGIFLFGFDTSTDSIQLDLVEGSGWQGNPDRRGLVVTTLAAENNGWELGDMVTLKTDESARRFEIIGLTAMPVDDGFMNWQDLALLAGEQNPGQYWLHFADDSLTGADVDRKIGDIRELLTQHGIVAVFDNPVADAEENAQTVLSLGLLFNIASLLMAAVGAIGLLTMLSISVFERQREIGVMRSVGANSRAVAGQFLTEGLMVGLIAWLLGFPLSYGIGSGLMSVLPVSEFGFHYSPIIAPVGLFSMLLLAVLASLWPSISASRRTVADILRYR